MNYYLTNFDLIRTEKSLKTNNIDYSLFTKLTDEQINWFVKGNIPEGKQRKSGTLELEDTPDPTDTELALMQISSLESKQTQRRLREAALGDTDSIAFLQDIDDQISELRKSLST